MKIIVRDPDTEVDLELDAMPEQQEGHDGWQILFSDGKQIFIYEKHGKWHTTDAGQQRNQLLIQQIGEFIKPA